MTAPVPAEPNHFPLKIVGKQARATGVAPVFAALGYQILKFSGIAREKFSAPRHYYI
ncbi:hypothetical protein [Thalassobius vesicularis]|uniref:hypothetical protein n=1 Tax=Thalassobius vesicularis TaxID=1294297 RepID=UPI001454B95B|nr:hypothetical protein [Thalassobius vesicularis]